MFDFALINVGCGVKGSRKAEPAKWNSANASRAGPPGGNPSETRVRWKVNARLVGPGEIEQSYRVIFGRILSRSDIDSPLPACPFRRTLRDDKTSRIRGSPREVAAARIFHRTVEIRLSGGKTGLKARKTNSAGARRFSKSSRDRESFGERSIPRSLARYVKSEVALRPFRV